MSTNFAKTLVWKQDYDVKLWRHKQRIPNTNDPMPLNETPPIKIFCVRHCSVVVWPQIFRLTFCSFWVVLKTWPYLGLFACGITFRKFQHSKWLYVLSHKYACLPDSWNCPITLLTRKIEIIDEWRRMINNSHWYVINRSNFLSAVCGLKSSQ